MNKIIAQNFPKQALDDKAWDRAVLNDTDCDPQTRAVSALKIVEEEFRLRYSFAKENGDQVHLERAQKKLLEIRTALAIIEYGLNDGEYPVGKNTPSKIVVS
jgi:hypothetical protein